VLIKLYYGFIATDFFFSKTEKSSVILNVCTFHSSVPFTNPDLVLRVANYRRKLQDSVITAVVTDTPVKLSMLHQRGFVA
jgi:hypothetical protein